MLAREIFRAAVTEAEIAVAAEDVLVAAVVDAGAAGVPAVVVVDAMVVMAAVAEDDTKPFATDIHGFHGSTTNDQRNT